MTVEMFTVRNLLEVLRQKKCKKIAFDVFCTLRFDILSFGSHFVGRSVVPIYIIAKLFVRKSHDSGHVIYLFHIIFFSDFPMPEPTFFPRKFFHFVIGRIFIIRIVIVIRIFIFIVHFFRVCRASIRAKIKTVALHTKKFGIYHNSMCNVHAFDSIAYGGVLKEKRYAHISITFSVKLFIERKLARKCHLNGEQFESS